MRAKFKIGDRVSWNSEAGRVSGTIIRVHTRDFEVKGYSHHASGEAPQYEIKSSKTEHIAFHKGSALTKLGDPLHARVSIANIRLPPTHASLCDACARAPAPIQ